MGSEDYWFDIEEITENICGVIVPEKGGRPMTISEAEDEVVDREYTVHFVFDENAPDTVTRVFIARGAKLRDRKNTAVHRTVKILLATKGRSMHFPKLTCYGKLRALIFGDSGEQAPERDPDWTTRPCCVVQYDATQIGSLLQMSPTGTVPLEPALLIGAGCIRALASLHRLGYVHRLVTPYTFAFPNPLAYDSMEMRMMIIDVSLALHWPSQPRAYVPFIGSLRYSSVRVHRGEEQGPSDDIISVIYIVAELISGRLPWRSVFDRIRVCQMKCEFYLTREFKRLPREIRGLYRKMYLTPSPQPLDYKTIIEAFQKAILRRFPDEKKEFPHWMNLPFVGDL